MCFLLDFKCFLPRNLIESLISFGIWWINLPGAAAGAWSWVPSRERFYAKGVTKWLLPASGGILWRFLLTNAPYHAMLRKGSRGGGDYETNTITSVNISYTYTCNNVLDLYLCFVSLSDCFLAKHSSLYCYWVWSTCGPGGAISIGKNSYIQIVKFKKHPCFYLILGDFFE